MDLPEDTVYNLTEAFWENIGDVRSSAPSMERVTVEDALSAKNIKLYPGAMKYSLATFM